MLDKIEEVARKIFWWHTRELLGDKLDAKWEDAGVETQNAYLKEANQICQLFEQPYKPSGDDSMTEKEEKRFNETVSRAFGLSDESGLVANPWEGDIDLFNNIRLATRQGFDEGSRTQLYKDQAHEQANNSLAYLSGLETGKKMGQARVERIFQRIRGYRFTTGRAVTLRDSTMVIELEDLQTIEKQEGIK